MDVNISCKENLYSVKITGRIDSTNAEQFAQLLQPVMELKNSDISVDCADLEYTSSQGLRVFLLLQKSANSNLNNLYFINMIPQVKEVFDITGFSSIIKII